jgi:PadR family transcriptional regulator PadR
VSLGTVYKTAARLEAKGYLLTRITDPLPERGGRRKKLYEVSPAGREALLQSLADLARLARGVPLELEAP